jgi:hypothetical protein
MVDMTGLADEARAKAGHRGPRCQVQELLNYLPGEAAEHVEQALADKTLTNPGIYRALRARMGDSPYVPSQFSIGNHRRGNCRCGS